MTLMDIARSCKVIVHSDQQNQRQTLDGAFCQLGFILTQLHRNWSILQDLKTSGLLILATFEVSHFLVPPVGAKIAKWLVANKVAKASLAGWASPRELLWGGWISSWTCASNRSHVIHPFIQPSLFKPAIQTAVMEGMTAMKPHAHSEGQGIFRDL